jgi:hypothetical protein
MGHLERLGGMVVRPRTTLARLLEGDEGRAWSILLWLLLLDGALAPAGVGRGLLVARVDVLDGLFLLLNGFTRRMAIPLAGAVGAAVVLSVAARGRGRPLPLDRALDVAAFLLVPFLAVMAGSVLLGIAGWSPSFLPHHGFRGPPGLVALRAGLAFAGSLALLVLAVRCLASKSASPE